MRLEQLLVKAKVGTYVSHDGAVRPGICQTTGILLRLALAHL